MIRSIVTSVIAGSIVAVVGTVVHFLLRRREREVIECICATPQPGPCPLHGTVSDPTPSV